MTQEELNEKIGKNVRKYRLMYNANNNAKLTQAELANKIGVTTPMIGALESRNNKQGISIYNLYQICKVLEVPINKFFE